jgi:hypothetical protein
VYNYWETGNSESHVVRNWPDKYYPKFAGSISQNVGVSALTFFEKNPSQSSVTQQYLNSPESVNINRLITLKL